MLRHRAGTLRSEIHMKTFEQLARLREIRLREIPQSAEAVLYDVLVTSITQRRDQHFNV